MDFNPIKVAQWLKHQQDWAESGLSLRAYCSQVGIGYSTFYSWRKKLSMVAADAVARSTEANEHSRSHADTAPRKPKLVASKAVAIAQRVIVPNKLVPVSIKAPLPEIVMHSPAGWRVTISSYVDMMALAQLLQHIA